MTLGRFLVEVVVACVLALVIHDLWVRRRRRRWPVVKVWAPEVPLPPGWTTRSYRHFQRMAMRRQEGQAKLPGEEGQG